MALENVFSGAQRATESLKAATAAAHEMSAATKAAAADAKAAASEATAAMGEVAKSAADAAKNGRAVIDEFVTQTITATEQWRQQTGSLVNLTMDEAIANLKEGGGEMEATIAGMLEKVKAGEVDINTVRKAIREMGAEAAAVFEEMPLHELQSGLDDVNGTMAAMLEKMAEFRAKALGLFDEVAQGAEKTSKDVAEVAKGAEVTVGFASREMAKAFDDVQDKGAAAFQQVALELKAVVLTFEDASNDELVDELERAFRG